MPTSLQEALSPTSLPLPSVEERYGAFTALIARLLGAPPKFMSLAHESPLTMKFFLGAFRLCFRAPYCDLQLLRITPEQRRFALLESSITHDCPYCIGHAAAFGDMLRGPVVAQCTRRGDMDLTRSSDDETLKQLVHEVCGFSGQLTPQTRAAFVEAHGEEGFTQMAAMLSFMGWLNFTMSATGMHLESRLLPFAELSLEEKQIPTNLRNNVLDDGEEHMGEEEVTKLNSPLGPLGWLMAHVTNVLHVLGLAVPTMSALLAERRWFEGIPNSLIELDAWCLSKLGVLLGVLKNVDDLVLKRAMAFGLRLVFVDECVWTHSQKCTFMYVFATGVRNKALRDDAVALYKTAGAEGSKDAASELDEAVDVARSSDEPDDAFSAGLKYMLVCADPGERLKEDVIDWLLRLVRKHGDIVDLAGMVGHFGFLHRAAVLYPADD